MKTEKKDYNKNLIFFTIFFVFHIFIENIFCVESMRHRLQSSIAIYVVLFQEFLRKEFSEENVLFWAACESFKKTKNIDKVN